MKKNPFPSLLFLFCGLTVLSMNLSALELTVDEAVEMALTQNLSLKQEKIDRDMKEREADSYWNRFLPDVYAGADLWRTDAYTDDALYSYFYNDLLGTDYFTQPWFLTAFVDLSLDLSASTASDIKATRQEFEAGQISFETTSRALERDVRIQYYGLLIVKETIGIYEQMLETALQNYDRARRNFELGNARKVDMLSYQVNYESLKPELIEIQNIYETRLLEFKRIIGLAVEDELTLSDRVDPEIRPVDEEERLISLGLKNNLELQAIRKQQEILKTRTNEASLGTRTPQFGLSYSYTPTLYDPAESDWQEDWSDSSSQLDLTVTIPLNGFIPHSEMNLIVKNLKDEQEKLQLFYDDASRQTCQAMEELILSINKSVKAIEVHRLSIELARENYSIIEESYNEGAADYLSVQTAQDNLNLALISEKNELLTYLSSRLYLEYMVNETEEIK
ncbi:MAG: TolC family protein [Spirochaetales bacterium]|nr:TolC family protein [Spirochaetales bacterium]